MNNRLNIQDLAGLLSQRIGRDREEVEVFLRHFVALVSEGVYRDKIVKVKGLGTFKIIPVEQRESVHVNTGERILIPAHYKFSFLPDKDLREQVNKPFSIFETTELAENVDFSDMEESIDEKGAEDESEEEVLLDPVVEKAESSELPMERALAGEAILPKPQLPGCSSPETRSIEEPVMSSLDATGAISQDMRPDPIETTSAGGDRKCYSLGKKAGSVVTLIVLVLLVIAAFCYVGRNNWKSPVHEERNLGETDTALVTSSAVLPDSVARTACQDSSSMSQKEPDPRPLGHIRIKPGDRLTVIALDAYGHKLFWVYIYLHNKSVIEDPNNIPIGTELEIPAPELYGIDAKSKDSREKAALLQTEILSTD